MENVAQPTYTDPVRFVTVFNTESTPINPFGLMHVTGIRTDTGIFEIAKPTSSSETSLLVNGSTPIPAQDYGQASLSFPAVVAIDQAGANPVIGDEVGTVAGFEVLQRGGRGFQIMAVQPGDTVNRVLVDKRFLFGGGLDTHYSWFLNGDVTGAMGITPDIVDITPWGNGESLFSSTYITFPSPGRWFVQAQITGGVGSNSGQCFADMMIYPRTNSSLLVPIDGTALSGLYISGNLASGVTTNAIGQYQGAGTVQLSGIFGATTNGATLYVKAYMYGSGTSLLVKSTFEVPFPMSCTTITMIRLGDL